MNNETKQDLNEIKETIKNIQKSIAKLEKLALDDYYDDMTLDETKARLRMAEGELQRLGYIYDPNLGIYGFYCPGRDPAMSERFEKLNNMVADDVAKANVGRSDDYSNILEYIDNFESKVNAMYDDSMNIIRKWQETNEQIGPFSKCCPPEYE